MFESERVFFTWLRFIITRGECFQRTYLVHPPTPGFFVHWCSVMLPWNMTCFSSCMQAAADGERTFVCPSSHRVCGVTCQGGLENFILISSLLQPGLRGWYTVIQLRTGSFFFSSWYTITTSQQEVHGMGCKDSRFGSVLGQASWIWLFKGTFAWALSGGDTIERGDKQLHKSELNNSV